MTSILFRCDASFSIGTGHVIRCRTLARELKRRGAEVYFLCRRQPGDLIDLLAEEFAVLALDDQSLVACDGLEGRELYGAWLGCSQAQDAAQCLQTLAEAKIKVFNWLVVDHYGLDAAWEKEMLSGLESNFRPSLLVIDDLADRLHQADFLLDQNFFGETTHQRYQKLVPLDCRQFLGPHYALLGPEYSHLHPIVPPRAGLRRVLVFFGGVDTPNLTSRTLSALSKPDLSNLEVDVVLGVQNIHREAVQRLVAQRPHTTVHHHLPSLAGLIARADLAVGAGGANTWERACLGLPSLVVSTATNQLPFALALDNAGYSHLLGDAANVTVEQIHSAILARINNPLVPKLPNALTDGWGARRLAIAMLGTQVGLTFRKVQEFDESLLRRWTSDLGVCSNRSFLNLVSTDNHHLLSQREFSDLSGHILLALAEDGCPIGQISLHQHLSENPVCDTEVTIDLLLDRCAWGQGIDAELVTHAFQVMEERWGPSFDNEDDILSNNIIDNICFASSCYTGETELTSDHRNLRNPSQALPPSRITILSDRGSWINTLLPEFIRALWARDHSVRWIHHPAQLATGDVCFMLSCSRLLSEEQLAFHRHNLVVHASDLPKGQGWSPMSWQILGGANHIPVTLFEAVMELDSGPIYLQKQVELHGHELVDEWRTLLADSTKQLCVEWLDRYNDVISSAHPQLGEPSYFGRRRPADSQLDPESSLAEQFNLLRVVDNNNYPAFFNLNGRSFQVQICRAYEEKP